MEKGPGPVPFILQEGKLRLWEETDLLNQDRSETAWLVFTQRLLVDALTDFVSVSKS